MRPRGSFDGCGAEKGGTTAGGGGGRRKEGAVRREPRLSSLVVVGRVSEGKLQPVGFGQEDAHFLVAPVHCGKILQEDHQTLLGEEKRAG